MRESASNILDSLKSIFSDAFFLAQQVYEARNVRCKTVQQSRQRQTNVGCLILELLHYQKGIAIIRPRRKVEGAWASIRQD